MPRAQQPPAPGRRRFIKTVGMAGISTAIVSPILALAQTPATPRAGTPAATPAKPDSAAAPAPPPEISEDARSLAEIVRRRYGKHLTPDQIEGIARELNGRLAGGKALRESKLTNSDEPDVTFRA
ncbi:MAG: hypothetical protein HYR74_12360 [Candidatus Eisenbacteria bacterium]|nr:hypothetical protein [Candidatus Eisenbacteria bacterium]